MERKPFTRRTVLAGSASAVATGLMLQPAAAAIPFGPGDKFDLLIKGGEVLDPSQNLRARRDIGIRNGLIAAVEPEIVEGAAVRVVNVPGKLVFPGLVDLHSHPTPTVLGLSPDQLAPFTGTTTTVSAGDAGAVNLAMFRQLVIAQSLTRIYAFLHISITGLAAAAIGEMRDIKVADVDLAARTLTEHRDLLLGTKVRQTQSVVGDNGLEPLKRAIAATERAGYGRTMCHIGAVPGDLSDLLDLLRPGDILTHSYSGAGNNVVRDGKLLAAATRAKARGVIIDVGHGAGSFDFTVAEPAMQQGLLPDTISSDMHTVGGKTPRIPYLPVVMSKMMALGLSLEQVVAMTTINPARIIGKGDKIGTLQVGAPADVAVMELVEGPITFTDTQQHSRQGERYLRPVQTVAAGQLYAPLTYP